MAFVFLKVNVLVSMKSRNMNLARSWKETVHAASVKQEVWSVSKTSSAFGKRPALLFARTTVLTTLTANLGAGNVTRARVTEELSSVLTTLVRENVSRVVTLIIRHLTGRCSNSRDLAVMSSRRLFDLSTVFPTRS